LSRIENGFAVRDLDRLDMWAGILGLPDELRWFRTAPQPHVPSAPDDGRIGMQDFLHAAEQSCDTDGGDMNRRETLRLMSVAAVWLTAGQTQVGLDLSSLPIEPESRYDRRSVEQLARLNTALWARFAVATAKIQLFPAIHEHLGSLTAALRHAQPILVRQRLCFLTADMFQLAGEVLFDSNRYAEAAQSYSLAATASRDAGAMDLWACALTRHAYISVYEQRFQEALPLLDLALVIAARGDTHLSTRHWVSAVHAQALAGTGDVVACERALDAADQVRNLGPDAHNGGWLRFDGSRLKEDRGACYVQQRRPDLAEPVLIDVLRSNPAGRRRGVALVDLAIVGALNRDPLQIVAHAAAAIDNAHQTGSGVVIRKLESLRPYLDGYLSDRHVRHLDAEIAQLSMPHA
jgi:tetratricopeptide (TPR) repeat protein